jgi:hypothetical protein
MTLVPPDHFNRGEVDTFLKQCSFMYKCRNRREKNFILDLHNMKDISLLGQLLIYKFVSYTARNACFAKPQISWHPDMIIHEQFNQSGFLNIMQTYVNTPRDWPTILKSYEELKTITKDSYFFAPHTLLRNEEQKRNEVEQKFLDGISSFYSERKSVSVISICISELIGNFWAHATDDSETVMVSKGGDKYFELFFADNAQGIISTLKDSNPEYKKMTDIDVFKLACEQGVSSKKGTDHKGFGLYLVSRLAQKNHGVFTIYSEGYCISYSEKGMKTYECGYWKGTIIDLRLELKKPHTIASLGLKPIDQRITWRTL